jgi:hypothetical protein
LKDDRPRRRRTHLTPEAWEGELSNKAMRLAERQLDEGTASSQVITHFLKAGSAQARLEQQRLAYETELLKARTEAIRSDKRSEELYQDVIKAMRIYSGGGEPDDYNS